MTNTATMNTIIDFTIGRDFTNQFVCKVQVRDDCMKVFTTRFPHAEYDADENVWIVEEDFEDDLESFKNGNALEERLQFIEDSVKNGKFKREDISRLCAGGVKKAQDEKSNAVRKAAFLAEIEAQRVHKEIKAEIADKVSVNQIVSLQKQMRDNLVQKSAARFAFERAGAQMKEIEEKLEELGVKCDAVSKCAKYTAYFNNFFGKNSISNSVLFADVRFERA